MCEEMAVCERKGKSLVGKRLKLTCYTEVTFKSSDKCKIYIQYPETTTQVPTGRWVVLVLELSVPLLFGV